MGRRYILPQHYLFQLAEQSPNDLPALLNAFRAVPPVIKRRAKELLDEIRAGGSGSMEVSGSRRVMVDLGQTDGTKHVKEVVQGDFHSESGMVSIGVFCLRRNDGVVQGTLSNSLSRHTHSSACAKRHTRRLVVCYWELASHR